jgi:hypothetical protein
VVLSAIILCAAILGISYPSSAQTIKPVQQQIPLPGLSIRGGHNRRWALRLCLDGHYNTPQCVEKFTDFLILPAVVG